MTPTPPVSGACPDTGPEALAAWLRLTLIPGIGGETQRKLLTAFGLPQHIFSTSFSNLRAVIGDKAAQLLLNTDNEPAIATALQWAEGEDQHILTLADAEYPQALLEIPDPPSLLYVRGRCELLNQTALAIVGSRNPTPQGVQNAEDFAESLATEGLVIVSGLAIGIDTAAHRGALKAQGSSIAFIGTGIDRIYPARNLELAHQLARQGCVVSEFPLGTPAIASNFPRRNRLISGISRGVLVVEAAPQSGSLITARLAGEQGREVFAIPGSIHSPQSRGCHQLIKQGAKLVETAEDVRVELRWAGVVPNSGRFVATTDRLHTPEDPLLALLGFDPCSLDELAERSSLPVETLNTRLLQLELAGELCSLPGGRFQRLRTG